jgi:hypothetical protein
LTFSESIGMCEICVLAFSQLNPFPVMKWLRIGLTVFDAVSRVVDRIGPVSFEPMEKHPEPRRAPRAEAAGPGNKYLRDEEAADRPEGPGGPGAPTSPPDQD